MFATVGTGGINLQTVNAADSEAPYFAAFEGSNSNPTYGVLDLHLSDTQLTAQFVGTSGGTFTDAFTITKGPPPPSQPPIASFTSQLQGLTATFNGSGSLSGRSFLIMNTLFNGSGSANACCPIETNPA